MYIIINFFFFLKKKKDENDILQSRDISIGRYRRNHDYMSEILSPYNIDSIEPPEIIDINSKESLNNEVVSFIYKYII